jgi:hypothetical protein
MVVSGATAKLAGWTPQPEPKENDDMLFHRQLLTSIVFGLFHEKKQILKKMQMPSQPISLKEIWLEYVRRQNLMISLKQWKWPSHEKRWIDRRVNEIASPKFYADGKPKIVATIAGYYEPDPALFAT